MNVVIEALKAINPHLASVESDQWDDGARQRLLLDELCKYHDEGNMEDAEHRWRRQINLEAELGGGKKKDGDQLQSTVTQIKSGVDTFLVQ